MQETAKHIYYNLLHKRPDLYSQTARKSCKNNDQIDILSSLSSFKSLFLHFEHFKQLGGLQSVMLVYEITLYNN